MTALSKTAFKALYGSSGTTFPDNTTGDISEGDVRQFGEDIADSLTGIGETIPNGTTSGTDTYTVTITGVSAYMAGDTYTVKFANANTGAATININSLGAKALKKVVSTALASGDISSGQEYIIIYDGTNFQVLGVAVAISSNVNDTAFASSWNADTTNAPSKNTVYDVLAGLATAVFEIGDWDMDSTASIVVDISSIGAANVRTVYIVIRSDSGSENYYNFERDGALARYVVGVDGVLGIVATDEIYLVRDNGSIFNAADFGDTSYNRGWITIQYAV